MFETILGNEAAKGYLRKAVEEACLPHALLFGGPDGVGKGRFVKDLAKELLRDERRVEEETHPDFHLFRPEGKSGIHSIETLRELIETVHSAPFEGGAKIFAIYDAERMQPAAANALLKTLEEPTESTVLILVTSSLSEILPTIVSRCSVVRFHPLSEGEIGTLLEQRGLSKQYARLAHGSIGKAIELASGAPIEELLFPILARPGSYVDLALGIERLEKELEDEDPVKQSQKIERLFASILMWYRDQVARPFGAPLFFSRCPFVRKSDA